MGEPQTPHFCHFGFFGHVPGSQNQYYLSLETPGYLTKIKKQPWNIFKQYYFCNYGHQAF